MATYTKNYNLAKPESSDFYNHMLYDNNNMNIIDQALKDTSNNTITRE